MILKVNKLKIMNHKFFEYQTKEIKRAINDEHDIDYIELVIMTSPFYCHTPLFHHSP